MIFLMKTVWSKKKISVKKVISNIRARLLKKQTLAAAKCRAVLLCSSPTLTSATPDSSNLDNDSVLLVLAATRIFRSTKLAFRWDLKQKDKVNLSSRQVTSFESDP
jgi:hypothetical protein